MTTAENGGPTSLPLQRSTGASPALWINLSGIFVFLVGLVFWLRNSLNFLTLLTQEEKWKQQGEKMVEEIPLPTRVIPYITRSMLGFGDLCPQVVNLMEL